MSTPANTDVLFLTGTIAPPTGARSLARMDPVDRIADYRAALRFYIGVLKRGGAARLLLVENSGYGVAPFEDIVDGSGVADRIELLSYAAPDPAPGQSRFYGECSLLLHGFETSATLRDAAGLRVWKVTGRYIVRNIEWLMRRAPAGADLYLHCRDYPMKFVDFGIAGFSGAAGAEVLRRILSDPAARRGDERLLRTMVPEGRFDPFRVVMRLPSIPDFRGVRGKDNASYGGLRYRLEYMLRATANQVAPDIWL